MWEAVCSSYLRAALWRLQVGRREQDGASHVRADGDCGLDWLGPPLTNLAGVWSGPGMSMQ